MEPLDRALGPQREIGGVGLAMAGGLTHPATPARPGRSPPAPARACGPHQRRHRRGDRRLDRALVGGGHREGHDPRRLALGHRRRRHQLGQQRLRVEVDQGQGLRDGVGVFGQERRQLLQREVIGQLLQQRRPLGGDILAMQPIEGGQQDQGAGIVARPAEARRRGPAQLAQHGERWWPSRTW